MDLKLIKSKDIKDLQKQINELNETNMSLQEKWLFPEEAAEFLDVSLRTLLRMRSRGDLAYSKIGQKVRYKQSDLIKCFNKHYFSVDNIKKK